MPADGGGLQSGNTAHDTAHCLWQQPLMLPLSTLYFTADAIHHTNMMTTASSTSFTFPHLELTAITKWPTIIMTITSFYKHLQNLLLDNALPFLHPTRIQALHDMASILHHAIPPNNAVLRVPKGASKTATMQEYAQLTSKPTNLPTLSMKATMQDQARLTPKLTLRCKTFACMSGFATL